MVDCVCFQVSIGSLLLVWVIYECRKLALKITSGRTTGHTILNIDLICFLPRGGCRSGLQVPFLATPDHDRVATNEVKIPLTVYAKRTGKKINIETFNRAPSTPTYCNRVI